MSTFQATSGEKLRLERIRRGVSQDRLAKRMGITRQMLSAWETGLISPDFTERAVQVMETPPCHNGADHEAMQP